MWFGSILLVFKYLSLFKSSLAAKNNVKTISGPYKMIPIEIRNCTNPALPYVEVPVMQNNVIIKNNIMVANFSILRELKNYKVSMEDFYYENGKRVLTFQVKKRTCLSRFQSYLIKAAGIIMDKKTCTVPKNTYSIAMDFDKVEHLWLSTREYGLLTRRIEVYNKTNTLACYEYDFDVRPLKPAKSALGSRKESRPII